MGIFDWFKPKIIKIEDDKIFEIDIVGESHYQEALEMICGGYTEEGHKLQIVAELIYEDENEYDNKAIRIDIKGDTVGYLSREDARLYRKRMKELGYEGNTVGCQAIIIGGWDRGGNDKGSFGVKLYFPKTFYWGRGKWVTQNGETIPGDYCPVELPKKDKGEVGRLVFEFRKAEPKNKQSDEAENSQIKSFFISTKSDTSQSKFDTIKHLIKERRYEEAIRILKKNVSYTESTSRKKSEGVENWPYSELAKIYRKMKDYKSEIEILEQYLKQQHSPGVAPEELAQRLIKVYELAGQIEIRYNNEDPILYHKIKGIPIDNLDCFQRTGAIVDVETTGLDVKIDEIIDEYQGLREPDCDIDRGAFKKHGLTLENLKGKCLDKERIINLIEKTDMFFAHNASFDRKFLDRLFPTVYYKQWYCTMDGISWLNKGFASKKLEELLKANNIENEQNHRALSDAKAILSLISKIDNSTGEYYLLEIIQSGFLNW